VLSSPSSYICKISNAVPTFNDLNLELLTDCLVCVCSRDMVDKGWQMKIKSKAPKALAEG
jgi:hypothetical protein